ncbi:MAG: hypothetical protein HY320_14770 [Armatimonadetes bacterium]|nr:hypothetical protein [Armatimonadota bacterium]
MRLLSRSLAIFPRASLTLVAAALCLLAAIPAFPWGFTAHDIINGQAITALPEPLRTFYTRHRELVVRHSADPDLFREFDPDEGARHYLDIDHYGKYPFEALPLDYEQAVAQFGKEEVARYGLVPWVIGWKYDELVQAFRNRKWDRVLVTSAWLGHYVGDCHVPLHSTENYDGQQTNQRGVHQRWEVELVNRFVKAEEIHPKPAVRIKGKVHHRARRWLLESAQLVEGVLKADREALKDGQFDYQKFAASQLGTVKRRLTQAAHRLACLWYSAWREAERPGGSGLQTGRPDGVGIEAGGNEVVDPRPVRGAGHSDGRAEPRR